MKRFLLGCLLGAMSFWGQMSCANIIKLSPVDDGRIVTNALGFWYTNTTDSTLHLSRSGSIVEYGILEFDFAGIPDAAEITGATLHLTTASIISNVGDAPATLSAYGFAGDGVVARGDQSIAATLLASDTYPTGATNSPPSGTPLSLKFASIDALISAAADDAFFGLRLYVPSYVTLPVYSSEATNEAFRPYLSIDYEVRQAGSAPEPNSLLLASLGTITLLAMRRCRVAENPH